MNDFIKFLSSEPFLLLMCSSMGVAVASLVKLLIKKHHAKKVAVDPNGG